MRKKSVPAGLPVEEQEEAAAAVNFNGAGESAMAGDPNYMTSLERGLAVIQTFSKERRSLSISQISQRTGIPRAAVRRCIYTLTQLGFVAADDERHFVLRPKVLTLGHAYLASSPLAVSGVQVLKHVTSVLNESSSIGILDGNEILYIARAPTSRLMTIDLHVGSRLPAHCASMGRVLMSQLDDQELEARIAATRFVQFTANTVMTPAELRTELLRVRQQGYALIDQELEAGLRTIAVPIFNGQGTAVAATSVGVHAARATLNEMTSNILPVLREAAQELALLVK